MNKEKALKNQGLEFREDIIVGGDTKYFHNATMAVDYFFMLSGFGIYLSPKRPEKSYKSKIEFAKNKKDISGLYCFSRGYVAVHIH